MQSHPEWEVLNRGVNGERSDQIRERFDRDVISARPAVVVVIAGVNDVYQGREVDQVTRQLRWMYDRAQRAGIRVVAGTILPYDTATPEQNAKMRQINAWIRRQAEADPALGFAETRAAAGSARKAGPAVRLSGPPSPVTIGLPRHGRGNSARNRTHPALSAGERILQFWSSYAQTHTADRRTGSRSAGADDARTADQGDNADGADLHHRRRQSAAPGGRPAAGGFRGLRQRQAADADQLHQRDHALHRHRHARYQRQHDPEPRLRETGGGGISHAAAAG